MGNTYYECHITMEGDAKRISYLVSMAEWKFSEIAGDVILGDDKKCYATRHYNARLPEDEVLDHLHRTANNLADLGVRVLRRKVELVIYDDRSSKINPCIGSSCIECHPND